MGVRVQSRRTGVFPTTWEIPVGIGLIWLLAAFLALPAGQGIDRSGGCPVRQKVAAHCERCNLVGAQVELGYGMIVARLG
jgi:hypothetical protein